MNIKQFTVEFEATLYFSVVFSNSESYFDNDNLRVKIKEIELNT